MFCFSLLVRFVPDIASLSFLSHEMVLSYLRSSLRHTGIPDVTECIMDIMCHMQRKFSHGILFFKVLMKFKTSVRTF